jgi:hypothetical protein
MSEEGGVYKRIVLTLGLIFGLFIVISLWYFMTQTGRTASRLLGRKAAQKLEVPNLLETKNFIGCSFDKRGENTAKDITFLATDGYVYTVEFLDRNIREGAIRWVPFNESASLIRSRGLTRWVGGAVTYKLPKDCAKVLDVDVSYDKKNKRVKNLVYMSTDGEIWSKEYRDGTFEAEGWLKIVPDRRAVKKKKKP